MTYRIEPLSVEYMKFRGNALLEEHYQELTLHKEIIKLDVMWDKYKRMEELGTLFSIGLWEDEVLIGYSVFIVSPHPHYERTVIASNDVLFLTASKRKGRAGLLLIEESEKRLAKIGANKIVWHCKYGTVLGQLLRRRGYENEEYTVSKILGD